MAAPLSLVLLLMIHRVYGWYVNYRPFDICALKGSTVSMTCLYPTGYQITEVFWTTSKSVKLSGPEISQWECSSGYQENCYSISFNEVTQEDSDNYYCSFNCLCDHFITGFPGVRLSVTDLQVESPERVTEGDSVRLTCRSSCKLTDTPTFIWYSNSQPVTTGSFCTIGNELVFSSVSREHTGYYSCGVWGQNYISATVYLDVRYPPSSVSVSVHRSTVIKEGDSVTLSCSSDSNPPAEIYWYKGALIISKDIYRIIKISSDDSGEYRCRARNEHGVKYSDPVTLDVEYPPKSVSVSVSGSAVIKEGDSVTLNCSSDSNPPANISWFKGTKLLKYERIFSIYKLSCDDSGEYNCKAINKYGGMLSDSVTLNIMYPPRKPVISFNRYDVIMEGDSVTLSCSSDSNPPAEISWFKGNKNLNSGRIFNISKISSDDSGEYKCRARNEHGEKYSDPVTLNVQYPPRNVFVSISVIVFGDSVSLMCISDSNPPALSFSWFKENQSSAVGSGQSFSAVQSGRFYCEAHNPHGAQRSDAVTVTVHQGAWRNMVFVIAAASGGLFIIIFILLFIISQRKRINRRSAIHQYENNCPGINRYAALDPNSRSPDQYNMLNAVHPTPALQRSGCSEYENHQV
ncbi:B-cell receptor CD22-like [Danio aesculapii]|uniref:B-cell receptor CD22-like n=1 Tax=Danio aesculapii TaxID=1142201 RepID=UPI0024C06034|nr:B-cell receptor CD22-like [Danio aesculapii]